MTNPEPEEQEPLVEAHRHAERHYEEIQRSSICGCFYCLKTFAPTEINSWVEDRRVIDGAVGRTAICPNCNVDAVIGSESQYPITRDFLVAMRKHWFETSWQPGDLPEG